MSTDRSSPGLAVSPADFRRLRWIEGTWEGRGAAGTEQAPFWDRYHFVDDSTLVIDSYTDATRDKLRSSARVELRDGRLLNSWGDFRWVAAALDDAHVRFAPLPGAPNAFTWRRGADADSWTVHMAWTDAAGAAQERRYAMRRVR